ncbi:MAG: hypothetical protein COA88_11665 [Kordia sp.]|nr:MAG: hypothetical protein COA88_11665 [Kordia sp.]
MKRITLLFAMLLFSFVSFSQSIVIGTSADITPIAFGQPTDSYNQSFKYQMLITSTELSVSLAPYTELTALGFSIASDNAVGNLNGYTIKMGHTTTTELASIHDASPTIVVKNPFNYNPVVTAPGVFDMITFDTNFVWNGVDNVLVEICKDINTNAGLYPFGQVRVSPTAAPSTRYFRGDGIAACGEDTNISVDVGRPNMQFAYTTLSVDDLYLTEGFKFYPNPVNNVLNVSAKNTIEKLQIVNMLGQVIKTDSPNMNTYQLDFSSLSAGIYLVKVSVNNIEGTFRIVKK